MNNPSSWNCFSGKKRRIFRGNSSENDAKMMRGKHQKEVPDEQFANLLGGEFSAKNHLLINQTFKNKY